MYSKLYLEITNVCNLSCSFCPGTRRPRRFLSEAEFRTLAEKLRPYGTYLYFHVMGEPLLHPDLKCFLDLAGELGFRVVLTTNGTLLPKRQAELLASPVLHKVNISLHAPEANDLEDLETYLRGCTAFAASASERGVLCSLRLWNLDGDGTVGRSQRNGEVLAAFHAAFPEPWTENSRGYRLRDRLFLEWGETFDWPDTETGDRGEECFCYGLRDQLAVLSDGTVVPCCLDHEGDIPLGNLFRQELDEILKGPRARALYDGFSRRRAVEPLCRTCGYARRFRR